jgi:hypothetical protein
MVRHSLLLSKEGLLNHVLFLKTNIDEDKGRFPRPIIDWPEQHLGTSRATPGPPQDEYIGDRDESSMKHSPEAFIPGSLYGKALLNGKRTTTEKNL